MAADGPVVSRPPAHYRSTSLPGRISSGEQQQQWRQGSGAAC